jgi:hypothetical protein
MLMTPAVYCEGNHSALSGQREVAQTAYILDVVDAQHFVNVVSTRR